MCGAQAIAGIIEAGVSITGGIVQGIAHYKEGQFSAQVQEANAQSAEQAAGDAQLRGLAEQANFKLKAGQLAARQRMALIGANVDLTSGTAVDIAAETQAMTQRDAEVIGNNAAREAWGFKSQALNYRAQGELDKLRGKYAMAGSLLGGASGAGPGINSMFESIYSDKSKSA